LVRSKTVSIFLRFFIDQRWAKQSLMVPDEKSGIKLHQKTNGTGNLIQEDYQRINRPLILWVQSYLNWLRQGHQK